MNPVLNVAPAAEVTRRPTGDPPGDPPGDFGPVLAQAAHAPGSKGRNDGARTATAEGANTEAADGGGGQAAAADTGTAPTATASATVAETTLAAGTLLPQTAEGETAAPVPADDAPTLPQQQQPAPAANAGYKDPAPEEDGGAVVVKAPPGQVAEPSGSVPLEGGKAEPLGATPAATEAEQKLPGLKRPPRTEAAPAASTQAAAEAPTVETASETPAPPAAANQVAVDSRGHGHTSANREQPDGRQSKPPVEPVVKPHAGDNAATAKTAPAAPAPAHVTKAAAGRPEVPAATAADTPAQPQPVSTTAPQQAVTTDRTASAETPVRAHSSLAHLTETARTVVRMAAREGAAQAHITLHPAELGEVQIRLRYHAGGVSADVLADSQVAAQALQGAASELKRALEAQGLVVHGLDVRAGEHQKHQRAHEQDHQAHRGHKHAHQFDLLDQTTIETSSLPLPTGAVDVLA